MQRRRIEAFEDEKFKCKGKRYSLYGWLRPFPCEGGCFWFRKKKAEWTSLDKIRLEKVYIVGVDSIIDKSYAFIFVQSLRIKLGHHQVSGCRMDDHFVPLTVTSRLSCSELGHLRAG